MVKRKMDGKLFAVKAFSKRKLLNKQKCGKISLINEITLLRSINHPNIIDLKKFLKPKTLFTL